MSANEADDSYETFIAHVEKHEYAQALADENRLEPAKQALARAQEHAKMVQTENPKDHLNLSTLSSIHRNRGKVLGKQGKFTEALHEDSEAVIEEQACKFEHILSAEATERICSFLGHPKTCPHGAPIPPGACCRAASGVRQRLRARRT